MMAGLWMGCLPIVVDTGWYSNVPYRVRVCCLCDRSEVEDQCHFIAICPAFNNLTHCFQVWSKLLVELRV